MLKSWPRTVEVHIDSYLVLQRDFERHQTSEVLESLLAPRQVTAKSHFMPFSSTGGDFGSLFARSNVVVLVNAGLLAEELEGLGDSGTFQAMMKAELNVIQKGVDEIADKVIDGLEAVIKMKSPYPPEYREIVYKALRYSPGSGFDQLLTDSELDEIIHRLRINGTL